MDYLSIIQLALNLSKLAVDLLSRSKAPGEVIAAVEAAIGAIRQHRDDVITKQALEAQRG